MIKVVDEIRNIDLTVRRSRLNKKRGSGVESLGVEQIGDPAPAQVQTPIMTKNTGKLPLKRVPKAVWIVLGIFVVVCVLSLFPLLKVYKSAQETYKQAQIAWTAVKKQDIEGGLAGLEKTKTSLTRTQNDLHAMAYSQLIPIFGWYYSDADHLIKAGFSGIDSARITLESIKPYQDVLGLKGKSNFVQGTAEQRIQLAVTTLGKITPQIDNISGSLESAKSEIDKVDAGHYPPILGLKKVHDQLTTIKKVADEGVTLVNQARPLVKILPNLLGDEQDKKYLIIFQNDAELRPTGGFLTAYAVFRLTHGVVHVDEASDMYNLDNRVPSHPKAPEPILKYLPKVYTLNLRDANLSADFVESMKTFQSLYNTIPGKQNVDGIIALDTHVLVSTIKILDDEVYAGGVRFTSQTDKRCDCPQAIYTLESIADTPHSYDLRISNVAEINASRKDIIGTLLYAIMEKSLKSSPKKYWGPLIQSLLSETSQKHVLINLFNQDAQSGVEALNAAGRIKDFDGDYLHVNDTNFGGDKANLFTKEEVEQAYSVGGDGAITKTVTIKYKNPYEPSDCNLERGNLCLNGDYRDWVRIYVPKGSTLVDSKGSEVTVSTSEDLGKTVFDGFLTVRPKGVATFTVTYKLPFKVSSKSMPLLIQKQGGTDGNQHTIKVNGNQREQFNLETDKEIKISL